MNILHSNTSKVITRTQENVATLYQQYKIIICKTNNSRTYTLISAYFRNNKF